MVSFQSKVCHREAKNSATDIRRGTIQSDPPLSRGDIDSFRSPQLEVNYGANREKSQKRL